MIKFPVSLNMRETYTEKTSHIKTMYSIYLGSSLVVKHQLVIVILFA